MKKLILATAILLSFSTISMANSLQSLDKSSVKSLLDNKTITTISLTTLNGKTQDNVFTGYLSQDGKTNGSFASAPANQPQTDTGTWKVNDDGQLCMAWQHWNNAKEFCMSLYKTNNSIIFINQQNKLESVVMLDKIRSGNKM